MSQAMNGMFLFKSNISQRLHTYVYIHIYTHANQLRICANCIRFEMFYAGQRFQDLTIQPCRPRISIPLVLHIHLKWLIDKTSSFGKYWVVGRLANKNCMLESHK